MRELTLKKVF